MVYEPAEDSYLLERVVKEHSYGSVLDVGTGSGILAKAAQKADDVTTVKAVDIDPQAVAAARAIGIDTLKSDMFSVLGDECFDTIVSNTPYLPDEPLAQDVALDGGPKGFEWTVRLLEKARHHLYACGQLLVLISTRTNPGVVEQRAFELGYEWEIVAREKIPFEELLVYRFTRAFDEPDVVFLAKGRRSVVYRKDGIVYKKTDVIRVNQEVHMLKKANSLGIGPAYHFHTSEYVAIDFVSGTRLGDFWENASVQDAQTVVDNIIEQLLILDENQIEKQELINPYKHIIIQNDLSVVLIDWERARMRKNPQNIRQFHEHIARTKRKHPHLEALFV